MLKKTGLILIALVLSYLTTAAPAFAAIKGSGCAYEVKNDLGKVIDHVVTLECVPVIVSDLIFWALVFAGIVALALIILSGLKFLTSGGDPKQVEGARKTLTFSIIGLIVILLSFTILFLVAELTNVGCILDFPDKGFKACGL